MNDAVLMGVDKNGCMSINITPLSDFEHKFIHLDKTKSLTLETTSSGGDLENWDRRYFKQELWDTKVAFRLLANYARYLGASEQVMRMIRSNVKTSLLEEGGAMDNYRESQEELPLFPEGKY